MSIKLGLNDYALPREAPTGFSDARQVSEQPAAPATADDVVRTLESMIPEGAKEVSLKDFLARRMKSPTNPEGWTKDNEFVLLLHQASQERVNGWQAQAGSEPTISAAKLKQFLAGPRSGAFLTSSLMVEMNRALTDAVLKAPPTALYQPPIGPPAPREVAQPVKIADLPEHLRSAASKLDLLGEKGELSPGEAVSAQRWVRTVSDIEAKSKVSVSPDGRFRVKNTDGSVEEIPAWHLTDAVAKTLRTSVAGMSKEFDAMSVALQSKDVVRLDSEAMVDYYDPTKGTPLVVTHSQFDTDRKFKGDDVSRKGIPFYSIVQTGVRVGPNGAEEQVVVRSPDKKLYSGRRRDLGHQMQAGAAPTKRTLQKTFGTQNMEAETPDNNRNVKRRLEAYVAETVEASGSQAIEITGGLFDKSVKVDGTPVERLEKTKGLRSAEREHRRAAKKIDGRGGVKRDESVLEPNDSIKVILFQKPKVDANGKVTGFEYRMEGYIIPNIHGLPGSDVLVGAILRNEFAGVNLQEMYDAQKKAKGKLPNGLSPGDMKNIKQLQQLQEKVFQGQKLAVRVPVEVIEQRVGAHFFENLPPEVVEQLRPLKKTLDGVATLNIQLLSKKDSDGTLDA